MDASIGNANNFLVGLDLAIANADQVRNVQAGNVYNIPMIPQGPADFDMIDVQRGQNPERIQSYIVDRDEYDAAMRCGITGGWSDTNGMTDPTAPPLRGFIFEDPIPPVGNHARRLVLDPNIRRFINDEASQEEFNDAVTMLEEQQKLEAEYRVTHEKNRWINILRERQDVNDFLNDILTPAVLDYLGVMMICREQGVHDHDLSFFLDNLGANRAAEHPNLVTIAKSGQMMAEEMAELLLDRNSWTGIGREQFNTNGNAQNLGYGNGAGNRAVNANGQINHFEGGNRNIYRNAFGRGTSFENGNLNEDVVRNGTGILRRLSASDDMGTPKITRRI